MILTSIDKNLWYKLEIEKSRWAGDNEPCICFELNNLSEQTRYPILDETAFIMSIQDAKELKAWSDCVLDSYCYKSPLL